MHVIQAHHLKISKEFRKWPALEGYQLRYLYFLDKSLKSKLTVPVIPFSKIQEVGASMYKGVRIKERLKQDHVSTPDKIGGAAPTQTLQLNRRD